MTISRLTPVSAASSTAGLTRAVTLPTLIDDDFVLLVVGLVTATAPTVSLPAGWTNDVPLVRPGSSTFRMGVWSKKAVAASDSGASVTVTSTVSGQITVVGRPYRGVDPATPYDVAIATATSSANDTTPDAPTVTPDDDDCMICTAYGMATTTGTNWTDWSAPAGLANAKNECSTVASVNNAAVGTSDLLQTTAAATGTMTATAGPSGGAQSHPWVAMSMVLRPAGIIPPPANLGGMWGVHL